MTKPQPTKDSDLKTRAELAAEYGVVPFTITRWEQDGMPVAKKSSRGKSTLFSSAAVAAWREAVAATKVTGLSLSDERAKYTKLQAEKASLELARLRGELLERRAVLFEGQQFTKALGAKIKGLPRMFVNAGLVPRGREAEAAALLRDLLTDISQWKFVEDLARAAGLKDAS